MKKFLQLKKSIIQSKDEPMMMQTYIDSIRSSCYKIAAPIICQSDRMQISSSQCSDQQQRNMGKPIKSMSFHSLNQTYKKSNGSEIHKLQDVIETLESACKQSENGRSNNQKQIITTILNQLSYLQRKQVYKQPINLIRKIIQTLPNLSKFDKIIQTPYRPYNNIQSVQIIPIEERQQNISTDSLSKKENKQNMDENLTVKNHVFNKSLRSGNKLFTEFEKVQQTKNVEQYLRCEIQRQKNIGGSAIKYKTYLPNQQVQGEAIYLDEQSQDNNHQQECTSRTFSSGRQSLEQSAVTQLSMGLEKITEKDQQQSEQKSDDHRNSIQMKKIMYMLESSTQKKNNPYKLSIQSEHIRKLSAQSDFMKQKLSDSAVNDNSGERTLSKKEHLITSSRISLNSSKVSQRDQKTKTIKDIVKLLDNKYQRTVKFQR